MNADNPLKKFVKKDSEDEGLSPMNPPDAFAPSTVEAVAYEDMHPMLQKLMDEHKIFLKVLDNFESSLNEWRKAGWIFNEEINKNFRELFSFLDNNAPVHNKKEEKQLFPLLQEKLFDSGEHSSGEAPRTGVDIMEDEHILVAQSAALCLNFLGLGSRLKDKTSREMTFELAYNQGKEIIEVMKLHIYREDEVLFPLAMKLFNKEELQNL